METFGQILRRLRLEKKLDQKELAARAGLHLNHISQFETQRRTPSYDSLLKLACALGVSLEEFNPYSESQKTNSEKIL